jgi:hypothetical protein
LLAFGPTLTRDLSFEERVRAQRSIEQFYYAHQTGAPRPFEDAVPRAVIEKKVRTYLAQSAALDKFWHTPITAEMLQKESERIARSSRMPDRLKELYAALGNDVFLFQETVARQTLVDRLTRSFFSSDQRIHQESRAEIEMIRRDLGDGALDPSLRRPGRFVTEIVLDPEGKEEVGVRDRQQPVDAEGTRSVHLSTERFREARSQVPARIGEVGLILEGQDRFTLRILLEEKANRLRFASFEVEKRTWDDWWAEVSQTLDLKSVRAVASPDSALPRLSSSANEWNPAVELQESARIESLGPSSACAPSDTWDNGSLGDVPDPRTEHGAVWTGSLMIVWGGNGQTGGRYDPVTDWWTATSTVNAPSGRSRFSTVWTGNWMIVWGGIGSEYLDRRAVRSRRMWTPTQTSAAPGRSSHVAVRTGSEMLDLGRLQGAVVTLDPRVTNTGAGTIR